MTKPLQRCSWVPANKPYYVAYHDTEWGVPVHDDRLHFEMLSLEGAQCGLSWDMILRRRDGYREAFKGFDPKKVARMTDAELETLLNNPGIIRHRNKVFSVRTNSLAFLAIQKEFGSFDAYIWKFVGGQPLINRPLHLLDVPPRTELSDTVSADLVKRGLSWVGTAVVYSYLQAVGLINDHTTDCFRAPA
jgi:DNA-3-methyladenine glycosylase I